MQPQTVTSPFLKCRVQKKERLKGENMMNLQESKKIALNTYKIAKIEWMNTVSKDNIKGDFEKWKIFCDAKRDCMKLGIRI